MSVVTSVLLISFEWPVQELEPPAIVVVNDWLHQCGRYKLRRVDDIAGGEKAFGRAVYSGAFNLLNVCQFKAVRYDAPWSDRESV